MPLDPTDLETLRLAKQLLDHPGLIARIGHVVGKPIEKGLALLPRTWQGVVNDAAQRAIEKALDMALRTLDPESTSSSSNAWRRWPSNCRFPPP